MIIDRLYESVMKKGHVCLGLDTDIDYIPEWFFSKYDFIDDALFAFNKKIIDATIDVTACYKVQIAYYEACGLRGLNAYGKTLSYIRSLGGMVIADIKRGDIAKTAEMYAKAHFTGDFESDFITLNPYMGMDSLEPYLPYLRSAEKGVFILVRTSNKGSKDIQFIKDSKDQPVYRKVGTMVKNIGNEFLGSSGYSSVGAVMGCTHINEVKEIRSDLSSTFFLIPGYGAQGGTAKDVALYLKNGNGGIVNASRSILLAYRKTENGDKIFEKCAREEVKRMRDDILSAVKG